MSTVKNIANIITLVRIVVAFIMLFTAPFSYAFWICYLSCGISDLLDGAIARGLKLQSEIGAKLDSIADLVFACSAAAVILTRVLFPVWLWICILCIAIFRIVGYFIGYCKYKTLSALHTYANKATGVLVFFFPLLYRLFGLTATGIILCTVAFVSALEEVIITVKSRKLNRECGSLFHIFSGHATTV